MNTGMVDFLGAMPELKDAEFRRLSRFIQNNYGIKMPLSKRIVLQGRLQKRLKALSMSNFKEYADYVFSPAGKEEIIHMIDVVSTNKTDFFREPSHFVYMSNNILPALAKEQKFRKVNIWSAGCSSGEEPYTLAMVMSEFCEKNYGMDFGILATDISTLMLQQGADAIYREDRIIPVPAFMRNKYLMRSKDQTVKNVRVVKHLRDKIQFRRLNFMDPTYPVNFDFDIIFCRNALIYFERQDQENIIKKLIQHLKPGGYFILGHSETITNMDVPLESIGSTIYRKKTIINEQSKEYID